MREPYIDDDTLVIDYFCDEEHEPELRWLITSYAQDVWGHRVIKANVWLVSDTVSIYSKTEDGLPRWHNFGLRRVYTGTEGKKSEVCMDGIDL